MVHVYFHGSHNSYIAKLAPLYCDGGHIKWLWFFLPALTFLHHKCNIQPSPLQHMPSNKLITSESQNFLVPLINGSSQTPMLHKSITLAIISCSGTQVPNMLHVLSNATMKLWVICCLNLYQLWLNYVVTRPHLQMTEHKKYILCT